MRKKYTQIRKRLIEIAYLGSALGLLSWDQQVNLPEEGAVARGEQMSFITGLLHKKTTAKQFTKLVDTLIEPSNFKQLLPDEKVVIRELHRDLIKIRRLPYSFVKKMSQVESDAFTVWQKAKQNNDFNKFQPFLEKIVALKQKQAHYYGFSNSPYDPLLDDYEPNLTSVKVAEMFDDLKPFLIPLVNKIVANQKNVPGPNYKFSVILQRQLCREISEKLGYNLRAGRMDESSHPFSTGLHPTDVRITARYNENDLWMGVGSIIHETGHALYNQGLSTGHYGTALGESISYGIHESQSRLWENMVGKSAEFVTFIFPYIKKFFPDFSLSPKDYYRHLNAVEPTLIRTESDEVTYNLHIIIRFEIEKELIEGKITAADAPKIWNDKYKKYLGIDVPSDSQGILQDIHWSGGSFGYFPTYTLGNLYAAQLWSVINKKIPRIKSQIAAGNFAELLAWLRTNIHIHGRRFSAEKLITQVTGATPSAEYFKKYLEQKFI